MQISQHLIIGFIPVLLSLYVTFVLGDRFTGLCPVSFPRRVLHNMTGHCYEVGSQGPCGRMASIASDPYRPNFGICKCKDYGSNNCFGRPLIAYGERCYFAFSQGPCRKGQWFVRNIYGYPVCRKNPCPIIESQRDLLFSEFPESDFYFTMYDGNKCFKTGTVAFCKPSERVYFLGADPNPQCLSYDPYNCNPSVDSGFENSQTQGLLAFGVPYDGI